MIEKTIPDFLTSAEILAQTGEEAAELAQAALKLRRALTGENPTPKSIAECLDDPSRRICGCAGVHSGFL